MKPAEKFAQTVFGIRFRRNTELSEKQREIFPKVSLKDVYSKALNNNTTTEIGQNEVTKLCIFKKLFIWFLITIITYALYIYACRLHLMV